jgi:hypothetical protein
MPVEHAFQRRLESIEDLINKIGSAADPHLRKTANDLLALVMELHGTGIERILDIICESGAAGQELIDRIGADDLAGSLLVLHGLHPLDMEARIRQALLKVHGGEVRELSVAGGAVVVKLQLTAAGSGRNFRAAVEQAIYNAAPDIASLRIEGAGDNEGFVPLEMLRVPPPIAQNGHAALAGKERL